MTTFDEFWDWYQTQHTNPLTRKAHAVATSSAIGLFALALKRRSIVLALLAPVVDYAIAQASHRRFEGNRTRPWKHPIWHARAELRMWRQSMKV